MTPPQKPPTHLASLTLAPPTLPHLAASALDSPPNGSPDGARGDEQPAPLALAAPAPALQRPPSSTPPTAHADALTTAAPQPEQPSATLASSPAAVTTAPTTLPDPPPAPRPHRQPATAPTAPSGLPPAALTTPPGASPPPSPQQEEDEQPAAGGGGAEALRRLRWQRLSLLARQRVLLAQLDGVRAALRKVDDALFAATESARTATPAATGASADLTPSYQPSSVATAAAAEREDGAPEPWQEPLPCASGAPLREERQRATEDEEGLPASQRGDGSPRGCRGGWGGDGKRRRACRHGSAGRTGAAATVVAALPAAAARLGQLLLPPSSVAALRTLAARAGEHWHGDWRRHHLPNSTAAAAAAATAALSSLRERADAWRARHLPPHFPNSTATAAAAAPLAIFRALAERASDWHARFQNLRNATATSNTTTASSRPRSSRQPASEAKEAAADYGKRKDGAAAARWCAPGLLSGKRGGCGADPAKLAAAALPARGLPSPAAAPVAAPPPVPSAEAAASRQEAPRPWLPAARQRAGSGRARSVRPLAGLPAAAQLAGLPSAAASQRAGLPPAARHVVALPPVALVPAAAAALPSSAPPATCAASVAAAGSACAARPAAAARQQQPAWPLERRPCLVGPAPAPPSSPTVAASAAGSRPSLAPSTPGGEMNATVVATERQLGRQLGGGGDAETPSPASSTPSGSASTASSGEQPSSSSSRASAARRCQSTAGKRSTRRAAAPLGLPSGAPPPRAVAPPRPVPAPPRGPRHACAALPTAHPTHFHDVPHGCKLCRNSVAFLVANRARDAEQKGSVFFHEMRYGYNIVHVGMPEPPVRLTPTSNQVRDAVQDAIEALYGVDAAARTLGAWAGGGGGGGERRGVEALLRAAAPQQRRAWWQAQRAADAHESLGYTQDLLVQVRQRLQSLWALCCCLFAIEEDHECDAGAAAGGD